MLKLGMAVAGLVVLIGCRSGPRDQAPASQAAADREIAGAMPPPLMDTEAAKPPPVPTPPPQKRPVAQPHHRKPAAEQPAHSQPAAVQPAESVARGTDRVQPASAETSASPDSSAMGYSSYAAPDSTPPRHDARILAAGTVIHVSLQDSINSRLDTYGKQISGTVMENVKGSSGEVLARTGTPLRLTVTRLRSGHGSDKGDLEIRPDSITINGQARQLTGKIGAVPYELKGRGVTGSEAAKVGVGAAGGAVVGRVITGKTKGAVIGGVIGAAGGAAVASQTAKKDVVVAARTPVEVVLSAPLVIR
jgi:hypothetical protein